MRIDQLLKEFAIRHRLAPLVPDEQGAYSIYIDDDLRVTIECRTPTLALVGARLDALPDQGGSGNEEQMSRLLKYHFACMANHQEILAADVSGAALVQFLPLDMERLSLDDFETALASFANAFEFWRDQLASLSTPTFARPPMNMLYP
ncbi:MAG: CesT family type III secretion system chaperone [Rhodospirillaceae bacterium]